MPVAFSVTGVPSNKQGKGDNTDSKSNNGNTQNGKEKKQYLDAKKVAYFPLPGKVAILKPFIDKLAITYKLSDDPDLKGAFGESVKWAPEEEPGYFKIAQAWKKGSVTYAASVVLTEPNSKSAVLIQFAPKKSGAAHDLRLEFNPDRLGVNGMAFLKLKLEAFVSHGFSFDHMMASGKITRADIAVDIVGVSISRLNLRFFESGKSLVYYSGKHRTETAYLGLKQKNCPWTVYNKRQQLIDMDREPIYGELAHTRVEFKAKPNKPLGKLGAQKNPFERISLALPDRPAGVDLHVWDWFLDSCHCSGEEKALQSAPSDLRAVLKKSLDVAHAHFWRPPKIWEVWQPAFA